MKVYVKKKKIFKKMFCGTIIHHDGQVMMAGIKRINTWIQTLLSIWISEDYGGTLQEQQNTFSE